MKVWAYLFGHKIKSTIKAFQKSANKRIVYLSIGTCLKPFYEELDQQWNSNILLIENSVPKLPYAKIRMEIIELNEKYDNERKRINPCSPAPVM